jgi:chromosomal replication initiation ATPase DnaA
MLKKSINEFILNNIKPNKTNTKPNKTNTKPNTVHTKNITCDNMYCLSYDTTNYFPFAKLDKKLITIQKEKKHKQCKGKLIKSDDKKIKFELLPNVNRDRDMIYISASSGAGKSYFANQYIKKYKKLYPKNNIFLFSKKQNDKSLSTANIQHININNENIEDFIELDYTAFENSLVLFDDIENISHEKYINTVIINLASQMMNLGRSIHTSIIMISHSPMGGHLTKSILGEANIYVIFPYSGMRYQYTQFLKQYVGLDPKKINDILNLKSRWLCIFKDCPRTFMTENKIWID